MQQDDVRWEKIREIRAKIARGYYDRPEVLARVVERLLRALRKVE